MSRGGSIMKQSNLIIWGGVKEWQLCFNSANCLKAQTDEKETANLVKNSHYGFFILISFHTLSFNLVFLQLLKAHLELY